MRTEQNDAGGFRFLAGGGEMGKRIRAFDWSHSPLGLIEKWPQSLKTSVSLILNTAHPMWIGWGRDVTFLYNDAYIDVLSMAKHPQALGKPCSEVWAEIWDICGPLVEKVFQNGESSFRNDVRFLMNRGDFVEEKFYSFSYSPIRDESGNVGGLFCPTTDVTPKVLNTRRLQTLSELAAKSLVEKSTKAACASAAATLAKNRDDIPFALFYIIESEGKLASLEQSVGIQAGVYPTSPAVLELAGPHNNRGLWPVSQVFATPQLRVVSVQGIEGIPMGLAGQRVSQAVTLPVISGGQERPVAILVAGVNPARKLDADYCNFYELIAGHFATAVANARGAEEQKKRADMLAELDRAKTTFFSNVSHEFRTPLTLMLGPLEDLLARRKQTPDDGEIAELEVVHRNSLRLLKLVNTLLDFSRLEAGRVRAWYVETDLAALTADLASVFRSAMEKAGLEFTVDCESLAQPVFVDRDMWEKVVFNLLSNAFKFTLSGGVEISLRGENGAAAMRVRDTGIGIPADELPNVFKRFHRIENARGRSHEGTGIGLALASELVKLHGGGIEVESEPARGTVFKVKIPFGKSHLDPGSIGSPPAEPPTKSQGRVFLEEASSWLPNNVSAISDHGKFADRERGTKDKRDSARPRILLAEDNADMRDYICRLLNQRYEVEAVGDGADALEGARKNPPKLVLSDVMMPRLDGFGLVDITERKQAEALLRQNEALFSALVNQAPTGLYVVDAQFRLQQINALAMPAFEKVHPRMGRDFSEVMHILWGPAVGGEIVRIFRHTLATGERYISPRFSEFRQDLGVEKTYEWETQRVTLPDGQHGVVCYFNDITERTANEARERKLQALLADKSAHLETLVQQRTAKLLDTIGELEAFSYSIAHDMRAPLRSLQGFSEILLSDHGPKLDAECRRYLDLIAKSANRMDRLIQDVLNYGRVVRGDYPLEAVDVEQLLRGIVDTYPHLGAGDAEIVLQGPFPRVVGNEAMLTQIFSNLMGNAVKFVSPGVKPRLKLWAEAQARCVRFFVQDNGVGIAADQHEKIFGMFQRVNKNYEGTGIGLAIVKKAVERIDGTVGLESEPGRGSIFWIELRREQNEGTSE